MSTRDAAGNPLGWQGQGLGRAYQGDDGGLRSHHPLRPAHLVLALARAKQGQVGWSQRVVGFQAVFLALLNSLKPCPGARGLATLREGFPATSPARNAGGTPALPAGSLPSSSL